jgi:hypothetical protein
VVAYVNMMWTTMEVGDFDAERDIRHSERERNS